MKLEYRLFKWLPPLHSALHFSMTSHTLICSLQYTSTAEIHVCSVTSPFRTKTDELWDGQWRDLSGLSAVKRKHTAAWVMLDFRGQYQYMRIIKPYNNKAKPTHELGQYTSQYWIILYSSILTTGVASVAHVVESISIKAQSLLPALVFLGCTPPSSVPLTLTTINFYFFN